jgi:hypothetical protein
MVEQHNRGIPGLEVAAQGYSPIYRNNEVNHCPGCGRSHWFVGRITAECAYCATALALQHTGFEGVSLGGIFWNRDILRHGWHFGGPVCHSSAYENAEWG